MRFGLISDSHDRVPLVEQAVTLFNNNGVDAVLHCGDFVAPFSMLPFQRLRAPLHAVFGNNDGEKLGLTQLFKNQGWFLEERPTMLELNGFSVAMLHEPTPMEQIIAEDSPDLLVYGHTHTSFFEDRGTTMVANPGEACGWVTGTPTVALVDMRTRTVDFQII